MTDLERVRKVLLDVQSWAIKDLDAHLKEDAERESLMQLLPRAEWFEEKNRAHEAEAQLREEVAELRELARVLLDKLPNYDDWPFRRLRQLIEEKE